MRRFWCAVLGTFLCLAPSWGQSAGTGDDVVIDGILKQKNISWGNASWLVGRAVETIGEGLSPSDAAAKAAAAGWGPAGLSPEARLNLKSYSLMLVKAFSLPTGLMYKLFPGPRYAFRELVFRRILPPTLPPDGTLSGEAAMRYLQAVQDWKDGQR